MLVTLLIPVLNEEQSIPTLCGKLGEVIDSMPEERFEVVFVDDGSTDETVAAIQRIPWPRDTRCKVISLARNFGHQNALTAGYEYASGDVIVCLDADLQDPPEMIPLFLAKYREGYDVVYGIRTNRKEAWWMRVCFKAFYRLFNLIAERPMPQDAGDFGLVSNRVAKAVSSMPEYDRMLRALRSWVGYRQIGIPYNRPERFAGTTRYRLGPRIEGALDGLFGYSKFPIRAMLFLGVSVFLLGFVYLAITYIGWFFSGERGIPGWRSLISIAFMLGAANLIAISIVGEYVCRIYFQAKQRPRYIVGRVIDSAGGSGQGKI